MRDDGRLLPVRSSAVEMPMPWVALLIFGAGLLGFVVGAFLAVAGLFELLRRGNGTLEQVFAFVPFVYGLSTGLAGLVLMGFGRIVAYLAEIVVLLRMRG